METRRTKVVENHSMQQKNTEEKYSSTKRKVKLSDWQLVATFETSPVKLCILQ